MTTLRFIRLPAALALAAALGLVVAYAASLGPFATPSSLGADGAKVVAPPVAVDDVDWVLDWEAGHGFVVDKAIVTFQFTEDFTGRLGFYMALTGRTPLPLQKNEDEDLDVSAGDTLQFQASFESKNIPAEALEDIHVLVCDDVDSRPAGVCHIVEP